MDVTAIALEGLQKAGLQLDKTARRIAQPPSPDTPAPPDTMELSQSVVELLQAKRSYEANLKMVKAGEDLERRALDVLG